MEEKEEIPNHIFDRYRSINKFEFYPNIVRTKNIIRDGVDVLIKKNKLLWTNSNYDKRYIHNEGLIVWGGEFLYFKKLDNDTTYKLYILTQDITKVEMLIFGLNKYFTIDKI